MKSISISIIILLNLITNVGYACMCTSAETITVQYQKADFVATVKIIKNYKNSPDNNEYYKADVKIINQYKGENVNSIQVLGINGGSAYNSCGTFIKEGETRLIFGTRRKDNTISTYICTSYHQPLTPNYKSNKIDEKLNILKNYAQNYVTNFTNEVVMYPYDFKFIYNPDLDNYYSLIKVTVNKSGEVIEIESLTNDNDTLKEAYKDYFMNTFNWNSRLPRIIPKNKNEDITLFFEINPYRSFKLKP